MSTNDTKVVHSPDWFTKVILTVVTLCLVWSTFGPVLSSLQSGFPLWYESPILNVDLGGEIDVETTVDQELFDNFNVYVAGTID